MNTTDYMAGGTGILPIIRKSKVFLKPPRTIIIIFEVITSAALIRGV